jgi:hypothetical protein
MEAGSPEVMSRESGVWIISISPVDPKIIRDKCKVMHNNFQLV